MKRSLFVLAMVLATGLALQTWNGAMADDSKWRVKGEFGWFGVGTAHQIEEGHFYWVGEFSGTFFNDEGEGSLFHRAGVKCPAYNGNWILNAHDSCPNLPRQRLTLRLRLRPR